MLIISAGFIVDSNLAATTFFGYTPLALNGISISTLLFPVQPDGQTSAKKFESLVTSNQQDAAFQEWVFQHLSGSPLEAEAQFSPIETGSIEPAYLLIIQENDGRRKQIAQLRDNETRLRTLADNAPVMLKMGNARNSYYYFNARWRSFVGAVADEATPIEWMQYVHPAYSVALNSTLLAAYKARAPYEAIYLLQRADGEYRQIQDVGTPYTDHKGFFMGYISSSIDITYQAEEERLRRKEAFAKQMRQELENTFQKSKLAVLSIDQFEGVTYANDYLRSQLGNKAWKGTSWLNLFAAKTSSGRHLGSWRELILEDGIQQNFTLTLHQDSAQARTYKCNLLVYGSAQIGNGTGEITIIGEDVTEKNRVSKKLEETNNQLQDFLNNANDLVMLFSPKGRLRYVNSAWSNQLGYSSGASKQLSVFNLVAGHQEDFFRQQLKSLGRSEASAKFQITLVAADATEIIVNASISAKYLANRVVEYQAILYDITEAERANRARNLLFKVSDIALRAPDIKSLFKEVYLELKLELGTRNFVVTQNEGQSIRIFHFADEDAESIETEKLRPRANGLIEYSEAFAKPLLLNAKQIIELEVSGLIKVYERIPKMWLSVPLWADGQIQGLLVLQSVVQAKPYQEADLSLLSFISGQIAMASSKKRSEEQLKDKSARLNAIFDSSSHVILTYNRFQGLTSFNKNFQDYLLKFGAELPSIGLKIDQVSANQSMTGLIKKALDRSLSRGAETLELETNISETDQTDWWEVSLNPIRLENHPADEVSIIAQQITNKKTSELALEASEQKFRKIFESFQDVYFQTDIKGYVQIVSPSILEVCGYRPEAIVGKKVSEFYVYNVKNKRGLKQLLKEKRIRNFEIPVVTAEGSVITCICNISLFKDRATGKVGFEGVARDITELKRTTEQLREAKETAEKSLKVKEKFLANMSHEIRTPMNGIIGLVDMLERTKLSEKQKDYIDVVKRSSFTLMSILNDILDISKIEAGKMEIKKAAFALADCLAKVTTLFDQNAKAKGLYLQTRVEPDVAPLLKADEMRIIQILSNLVANAIKFTDAGGVTIKVSQTTVDLGLLIKIEVIDTGIGIDKAKISSLFESFNQLDSSSTKSYGGTGLGLAISKNLAEMMGGQMGVESLEFMGSNFWFSFVCKEAKPKDRVAEPSAEDENYRFAVAPNILLVDDNGTNRKVGTELLATFNVKVQTATDGFEAVEMAEKRKYDLILMDIQMPRMDGTEATKLIKAQAINLTTPIIAMTAYSMKEDRSKYLKAGMDDYLPKPVTRMALLQKLRQWLGEPVQAAQIMSTNPQPAITFSPIAEKVVLDMAIFNQLAGMLGREGTIETYQEFEQETKELLDEIIASGVPSIVLSNAHTIKGSAGTLGLRQLQEKAAEIETLLKDNDSAIFTSKVGELRMLFDGFCSFLDTELK